MREVSPGHHVACHFPLHDRPRAGARRWPRRDRRRHGHGAPTAGRTRRRRRRRRPEPVAGGDEPGSARRAPAARTRLDPSVRRASILDAAERVFDGRNPADVTFEEVAEAASVSRGLVYNYFGDKAGLITAIYLRTFERLDAALLEASTTSTAVDAGDGEAALRAVVGAYLRFAHDNQVAWRLIGAAEATAHPVVQAARQERFRRMAAAWGGSARGAACSPAASSGSSRRRPSTWLDSPGSTSTPPPIS